eukprot:349801-Chlamydomonas_euryale.AAC.33
MAAVMHRGPPAKSGYARAVGGRAAGLQPPGLTETAAGACTVLRRDRLITSELMWCAVYPTSQARQGGALTRTAKGHQVWRAPPLPRSCGHLGCRAPCCHWSASDRGACATRRWISGRQYSCTTRGRAWRGRIRDERLPDVPMQLPEHEGNAARYQLSETDAE